MVGAQTSAANRLSNLQSHFKSQDHLDAFSQVALAPPDAIFQLTASYKADTHPKKVNLGVGAYRDNEGKPYVLPVVRKAKHMLDADPNIDHEYLPIQGLPQYREAVTKLLLGPDNKALQEGRVNATQTLSGTGANHLAALFLAKHYKPWAAAGKDKVIYVSKPTWANHQGILKNISITPQDYKYYDPKTIGLDFDGFINDIKSAPDESVFLLHACAHNPTGVDPTKEQWKQIADLFLAKKHFAFFDCAYQGFASGDLDQDAWAVRHFVDRRIPLLVCQSFAKNAGLYGERAGALTWVASSKDEMDRISSQLAVLQRAEISNPPAYGGRIMNLILNDPTMFEEWKSDVKGMSYRIIEMRKQLKDLLVNKYKTPGSWEHVTDQIGMFSFTGLNQDQSKTMVDQHHIYMTANGRISMAGLTTSNVDYVAECIDKVVRG